jgi:hypothetical protein
MGAALEMLHHFLCRAPEASLSMLGPLSDPAEVEDKYCGDASELAHSGGAGGKRENKRVT